jgi:hypothetical protein
MEKEKGRDISRQLGPIPSPSLLWAQCGPLLPSHFSSSPHGPASRPRPNWRSGRCPFPLPFCHRRTEPSRRQLQPTAATRASRPRSSYAVAPFRCWRRRAHRRQLTGPEPSHRALSFFPMLHSVSTPSERPAREPHGCHRRDLIGHRPRRSNERTRRQPAQRSGPSPSPGSYAKVGKYPADGKYLFASAPTSPGYKRAGRRASAVITTTPSSARW